MSRKEQQEFAINSHTKANKARELKIFDDEIVTINHGNIELSITMWMPITACICKVSNTMAFILDNRANYKLIKSSDGSELSQGSLNIGETFSTPVIGAKNLLLIGSRDDNLYCFSAEKTFNLNQ